MMSLQCCCHTITRSGLKLLESLVMFTNVHRCLSFCLMFTNVHQCFFLLNIVYFSVCLTSKKFYWIEDQLTDVFTRFYTSASWCRRVGVGELASASWRRRVGVGELTGYLLIYIALVSSIYCRILNNS